ncbi:hypothetical protein D8B26_005743 [Coccidioides posadasii str. Silveira]|uniref:non-specific serine/threonine protein kinase n=1 Tax=Coccidioides posadasii (strain RMSCC 757 / Silveira) TaxID=443226 RepID=E9DAR8_COCPS|nr:protein kinase [Coccidioides posadasii str. Silveira]QVM11093.1 hypothetical protein D8B26_005743 [Coccidioides posadasii str. Silveira]
MRLVRAGCSLGTLVPRAPRAASLGLPVLPRQRYQPPTPTPTPPRRSRNTTVVHRRAMATLGAAPLNPRHFPASGFTELDPAVPIEEELLPDYIAEMYYPVRIGEVLNDRYQVVCKLGYGTTSTVWLARDLRNTDDSFTYVALKIYVNRYIKRDETVIYDRINAASNVERHPGCRFVRKLLTSFDIQGPHGKHLCVVHQALGMSMDQLLRFFPRRSIPMDSMKRCLRQLLITLDFLHTEAGIIHTDLQPKNLLLPVDDVSTFKEMEEDEYKNPSPRKVLKDRTIYSMRGLPLPKGGLPLICDFGEARVINEEGHTDDIMPDIYRAPEVVMHMKWNVKVDIWSIAMVAWDLIAPQPMFDRRHPETGEPDDRYLIAQFAAILGPPPVEFWSQSKLCQAFWDENGNWKNVVPLPEISLERLAADIEGEDVPGFLHFLQRILRWLPEQRPTTEELIYDPWLLAGLGSGSQGQITTDEDPLSVS